MLIDGGTKRTVMYRANASIAAFARMDRRLFTEDCTGFVFQQSLDLTMHTTSGRVHETLHWISLRPRLNRQQLTSHSSELSILALAPQACHTPPAPSP